MAQELSDKQKVAQILGEVEDPKDPAEIPEEEDPGEEKEVNTPEGEVQEETEEEPEKPEESEEEPEDKPGPLTKQFPNLKGETLEEYNHSLEEAYDLSFKEALRMSQELKDNAAVVAQAREIVAKGAVEQPSEGTPQTPAPNLVTTADEPDWIARGRELDREQMTNAFEPFKKTYPQVMDPENFKLFTSASDGVNQTLTAALGRKPTWPQLYDGIAGVLGWQPAKDTAKRDNAIKENAASTRAKGGGTPAPAKKSRVPEASVEAYMKMFTSKTREEAIKDLSEVVG
jgi:hypothetical protein